MSGYPEVSIVIVNYNGKQHLPKCIASLQKLNYPKDKIEIIIVDNGSKDGSVELLRNEYGFVRVITNTHNEGFAKPSNDGARQAKGEYVAFLNNDMRVDGNWLKELVASLENNDAQCAGSVILSWDGKLIDFVGGSINYYGLGYQDNFKRPLKEMNALLQNDRQILFACGGAMLVNKKVFLDAGGFDEDYFAYYEDVDLGWRLHVLGYKIVLSVGSRVCHKHNSTSRTLARERVQYLFERNKLYSIYKNYGEALFNKIFFSTLLLDVREIYLHSGIDGDNYKIENTSEYYDDPVRIEHYSALKIAALNDFVKNISKMEAKRRFIQSNRRSADTEIMKFVEKPFMVFPKDTPEFINTEFDMVKTLEIDKILGTEYKSKVLIVTDGGLASPQGRRHLAMAKALTAADSLVVTLACTDGGETCEGVSLLSFSSKEFTQLIQTTIETNIVILTPDIAEKIPGLESFAGKKFVVIDAGENALKGPSADVAGSHGETPEKFLTLGDFFICSNQEQKQKLTAAVENMVSDGTAHPQTEGLNRVPIEVIPFDTDEAAQAAFAAALPVLVRYCISPVHSGLKVGGGAVKLLQDDDEDGDTGALTGEDAVLDRLARIEARQEKAINMIRDDIRMTKRAQEELVEVQRWTGLMDSRFAKLKSRLGRFKLLSRFIH